MRFREDFLVEGRGWEEGDMLGELSIEKFVMKEAQALLALFKKKHNEKINMLKKFCQLEVRSSI